jgi:hypothetical protein
MIQKLILSGMPAVLYSGVYFHFPIDGNRIDIPCNDRVNVITIDRDTDDEIMTFMASNLPPYTVEEYQQLYGTYDEVSGKYFGTPITTNSLLRNKLQLCPRNVNEEVIMEEEVEREFYDVKH